jgi:hypothetical protein
MVKSSLPKEPHCPDGGGEVLAGLYVTYVKDVSIRQAMPAPAVILRGGIGRIGKNIVNAWRNHANVFSQLPEVAKDGFARVIRHCDHTRRLAQGSGKRKPVMQPVAK